MANISSVLPKDVEAPECGVDDMTKLAYLHEPGVLQNLRSRYDMNEIYVSYNLFDLFLMPYLCFTLYPFSCSPYNSGFITFQIFFSVCKFSYLVSYIISIFSLQEKLDLHSL